MPSPRRMMDAKGGGKRERADSVPPLYRRRDALGETKVESEMKRERDAIERLTCAAWPRTPTLDTK